MNVIEVKYSELVASLDKVDYHQMLKSHHEYLNEMEHNCFLQNETLLNKITHIIDLVNDVTVRMKGSRSREYDNQLINSSKV